MDKFDFGGWATKANILCSDGRTILKDAFKECDGQNVPLVWNHQHNDPMNVLGHAMLENREDGVYAYCTFNNTEQGRNAKLLVENGDITSLSILANKLKQKGGNVIHGEIKEVSLVIAPANPEACIDSIVCHGDGDETDEEAIIYSGVMLSHSDLGNSEKEESKDKNDKETSDSDDASKDKTIKEIFNSMTEEQQNVVYAMVGEVMEAAGVDLEDESDEEDDSEEETGGNESMKHNVFDKNTNETDVLTHAEMKTILDDAKRYGSLKDCLMHADYGIENIEYLFPDAKTLTNQPEFIKRDMGWVDDVMNTVHHSPFSRIKSVFANITEDDARAKGYIKGKLKKDEVFTLLKRTTAPTTIYKKQKMDRDDVVDITDFDVIAWLKYEMRMMLNEEIARAILIGDGRNSSSDDKINEQNIRPIFNDDALYTIQAPLTVAAGATDDEKAKDFIKTVIKSRKSYKGSGNPTLYTTDDMLTNCLLLTDETGRDLYADETQLAKKLRVKKIVTVPVMESAKGKNGGDLLGIVVNLSDYNVGADKGGAVNMFDDFDIDYNQQKYLIETRCSGALTVPYSAIAIEATVQD